MKRQWWHSKVAYEIYVKSFYDSNGDGIGDLPGVIEKLDYLKDLGADILWLSPVYRSPFRDQGYDISDYRDIDPVFGTMADMRRLLAGAKERDLSILMDLVVNHCSDQHPWFQAALRDPEGPYGDYFYFQAGKNGAPPNNWRSYFGGSAWEPVPGRENLYYLHLFAKEQPDLNWENPAVRAEIYDMMRFWLDMGLSGFRIDAIINIKKDLTFASYPPDRADGLAHPAAMLAHATGAVDFLDEMQRETFAKYDAFSIAELFNYVSRDLPRYIGDGGCFSTIFDFSQDLIGASPLGWYASDPVTPAQYRASIFETAAMVGETGFVANIIENHDESRGASRYLPKEAQNDRGKKLLALLLLARRGLPFLYQGQELGMTNKVFQSISEADDVMTVDEYNVARAAGLTDEAALRAVSDNSRDNARTPFPWSGEAHAGFTAGTPWLAANENYREINLAAEQDDPDSVYAFYKSLIALRKDPAYMETLVYGTMERAFPENDRLFAFYRKRPGQTLLAIANYSGEETSVPLSGGAVRCLIGNNGAPTYVSGRLVLAPYEALLLELVCK